MQKDSNCPVLGTGANPQDHSHVRKVTPLQTKKAELQNDAVYRTKAESDLDPQRESSTTRARRYGKVRPLGGS